MLQILVKCLCGYPWADEVSDRELLARTFDENDRCTVHFKCPVCDNVIPVEVEANKGRSNYRAFQPRGYGDVALSKAEEDDFYRIDVDHYLSDVVARDPSGIFMTAIDELQQVMSSGSERQSAAQAFKRMLFTQLFAILETYLADRLVRTVEDHDGALKALVNSHPSWREATIKYSDAFSAVAVVRDRVTQELLKLMYHNFGKVDEIYRAVFGTSVFANAQDKLLLFRLLPIRHDCVHRNGNQIDGTPRVIHDIDLDELLMALFRTHEAIEYAFGQRYR